MGFLDHSFVSSQNRVLYMYIQFVKYFYKFLSFGTYKSIVCMVNLICIGKFKLNCESNEWCEWFFQSISLNQAYNSFMPHLSG